MEDIVVNVRHTTFGEDADTTVINVNLHQQVKRLNWKKNSRRQKEALTTMQLNFNYCTTSQIYMFLALQSRILLS